MMAHGTSEGSGIPSSFAGLDPAQIAIAERLLRLVRAVFGHPPDVIGDLGRLHECLREAAARLPNQEPDPLGVVILRYGLSTGKPLTLGEVARMLGYTRERIRMIEEEVIRQLKHPRYSRFLRASFYTHEAQERL